MVYYKGLKGISEVLKKDFFFFDYFFYNIKSMKDKKIKEKNKERVRRAISRIFEIEENGLKRIKLVISKIKPFLNSRFVNKEKIYKALKDCSSIQNKKRFTERVLNIIHP